MTDYAKQLTDLAGPVTELRELIPGPWSHYAGMRREVMAEGALSTKEKELIALVVSVVKRCDGCVAAHARQVARAGATPEEVAEALSVALLLDGGPATTWGPRALEAYQQFRSQPPAG